MKYNLIWTKILFNNFLFSSLIEYLLNEKIKGKNVKLDYMYHFLYIKIMSPHVLFHQF